MQGCHLHQVQNWQATPPSTPIVFTLLALSVYPDGYARLVGVEGLGGGSYPIS